MTPQLITSDGYQDFYGIGDVLVVVPAVRDEYPSPLKEALSRRRACVLTGECPCGARLSVPVLVRGVAVLTELEHEPDCPAPDAETLLEDFTRNTR